MAGKHPVLAYMAGVRDGSIPACKTIKQAVERQYQDLETGKERGLHFDRLAAEHVLQFFGFLRHSKGEWAGQPFTLEPWQQFMLWVLFGWLRDDGLRRFRMAFVALPRKNGKTTTIAGIGLYLMLADGEPGAEIYSAATKRDQAKLSWGEAARMVKASPSLQKMVKEWRASSTLAVDATNSKFMPLGADADTMDGLNVHGALIDELHAHKTAAVVDVLETATGARRQPLQIEITTAGYDRESICYQHYIYSKQVLEGSIQDDSWFAYIAELDDGDDWRSEVVWAKANPNLGVSVKLDDLQRKAEKAANMPAAQNGFRRLHLNEWTQQNDRWIDLALWDANGGSVDESDLAGRVCYGGLDLSSVSDITAWVLVFPMDDGKLQIVSRFWCPESRLTDSDNRYGGQYQAWARAGLLGTTAGNAIDYQYIRAKVLEDASKFRLVDLNVDRLFQGYQLAMELQDEGLSVFGMGQGFLSMAPAMKTFERLLLDKRLNHGGNSVLRWMAGNVAVKQDPAGNLKPDKSESQGKIDGIVALAMALDRWERNDSGPSIYEDRELILL